MPFTQTILRNHFPFFLILAALAAAGCGSTCFQGFFNGGNGGGFRGGNPQSCPVPNVTGTMSAVVLKMSACENCSAATRAEHLFVTVRSIQLHPSPTVAGDSPDWIELAPHLADDPRQIDLIGDSPSGVLVENALVPAGNYNQLRVQFSATSAETSVEHLLKDACGVKPSNCVLTADGRVHPLRFPNASPELVIPFGATQSDSLLVLPDVHMDMRLRFQPQLAFTSSAEGLKIQYVLAGKADAVRQSSAELESSPK
jgi:hypothetical protein